MSKGVSFVKPLCIFGLFLMALLCICSLEAVAEDTKITTDSFDQLGPAICESKVIWTDTRNGNEDIYVKDLLSGAEKQITNSPANQYNASIYEDKIIWQDDRNEVNGDANSDIYMYDLTTNQEIQITNNALAQSEPSIYGDKIVWTDYRNGNADVYMYNLLTSTETQITTNTDDQVMPEIWAGKIIWKDYRNGNADIYIYDLDISQETQITNTNLNPINIATNGSKIAWIDYSSGVSQVYVYDIQALTKVAITTEASEKYSVTMDGNYVYWIDERSGTPQLYKYDLTASTEVGITISVSEKFGLSVNQEQAVWYDNRSGNWDIYITTVDVPVTPVGLAAAVQSESQIRLIWNQVFNATKYRIYKSDSQNGSYMPIYEGSDLSYTDMGLLKNATYWYKVSALNAFGESLLSTEISKQIDKPGIPTITLSNIQWTTGDVTFTLIDGADVQGLGIKKSQYKIGNDGWTDYSGQVAVSTEGQTIVSARTIDNADNISDETSAVIKIDKIPPTWISDSLTASTDMTSVVLNWSGASDNVGLTNYKIYKNNVLEKIVENINTCTISGLGSGTNYTFKVEAVDVAGNISTTGPTKSVTTKSVTTNPQYSGGGGGIYIPPVVTPITPEQNDNQENTQPQDTIKAAITIEKVGQTGLKVTLTEEQAKEAVNKAVETNSTDKKIALEVPKQEGITSVETIIPVQMMKDAKAKGIEKLEVNTQVAEIGITNDTVDTNDLSLISISVRHVNNNELTNEQKEMIGNNAVYDFNLRGIKTDGTDQKISNFNEEIEIRIPYQLKPGEYGEKVTVFYVNDNGELENKQGKYDSETQTVIFTTDYFSKYIAKENKVEFKDIDQSSEWARKYIEVMASKGIIEGTGCDNFEPHQQVTRAEFSALLVRVLKLKNAEETLGFKDVSEDKWYCSAVMTATQAKLVEGYGDGTFRPNDNITREDMAVMTARALEKYKGYVFAENANNYLDFNDANEFDEYAKEAVALMVKAKVLEGRGDKVFDPKANTTRAEAAKIIYTLFNM